MGPSPQSTHGRTSTYEGTKQGCKSQPGLALRFATGGNLASGVWVGAIALGNGEGTSWPCSWGVAIKQSPPTAGQLGVCRGDSGMYTVAFQAPSGCSGDKNKNRRLGGLGAPKMR